MQQALTDAHAARIHLLNIMEKALPAPRSEMSPFAPRIVTIKVPSNKVKDIIGKGGCNVRAIQTSTNSQIDLDEDGTVKISASSKASADLAVKLINDLLVEVEVGKDYDGTVIRITDFGAFVNILPGRDGLVHISQIAEERVENVGDYLRIGDTVRVRVLDIDNTGRIRLSIKALHENEAAEEELEAEAETETAEESVQAVEESFTEENENSAPVMADENEENRQ